MCALCRGCALGQHPLHSAHIIRPPGDGRKDSRNMLRNNWLPIKYYFQITNLMHNSFILQQYVCYITILNMFRAAPCSSSGGQIVFLQPLVSSLSVNSRTVCRLRADCSPLSTCILYGCLQRVTIPEAVIIQFDLLKMSKVLLETCWGS